MTIPQALLVCLSGLYCNLSREEAPRGRERGDTGQVLKHSSDIRAWEQALSVAQGLVTVLGPSPPPPQPRAQFPDADTLWPSSDRRRLSLLPGTLGEEGGSSQGAAGVSSPLAPASPSGWLLIPCAQNKDLMAPWPSWPRGGGGEGGQGEEVSCSWLTSGNGQICESAPSYGHGLPFVCACV